MIYTGREGQRKPSELPAFLLAQPWTKQSKEKLHSGKTEGRLRIVHRLAGGHTGGQNVPGCFSDWTPGLRSLLEPSENPAGQWSVQWTIGLFCCEKYHERMIGTAVVTVENNAEPARRRTPRTGSYEARRFSMWLVTRVGLETPTFYCPGRYGDQVQWFSETQFYPLVFLLEGP